MVAYNIHCSTNATVLLKLYVLPFYLDEIDGLPKDEATALEGTLDYSFLFSYAVFMFVRYEYTLYNKYF